MTFVIRQLNEGRTIGEKLYAMRKSANLTLSELAEKTKIRKAYLKAFEEDDLEQLPKPLYAKKFLKRYVQTLGGNVEYFLDGFEQMIEDEKNTNQDDQPPKRKINNWRIPSVTQMVKIASLTVMCLAVIGYFGWQVRSLIMPPDLTVHAPHDGKTTESATVVISGQTEDETRVEINGDAVLLNEDGSFNHQITLERGVNIVTIEGKKRYSQSAVIYRHVVLDQDQSTVNRISQ